MVIENPLRANCTLLPNTPINTQARWLAYEIEQWAAATLTGGLLVKNVPDHLREFVVDIRNRHLSVVGAIARIEPERG